ncbi:solute carrier family 28 member 3-like isoform X2 [Asterias amurensis]|uniref:solute carrier family 28 member 3-like isoform X2 n=1 Tax=Asterias amurensis TaxID=7602 RepID=UPI003AB5A0B7
MSKDSKVDFDEGNGRPSYNVNCVMQLDDISGQDVELTEMPPEPRLSEPGNDDVTDGLPLQQNVFNRAIGRVDSAITGCFKSNSSLIKRGVYLVLLCLYLAFVIWAVVIDFDRALALFIITILAVCFITYRLVKYKFGEVIGSTVGTFGRKFGSFFSKRKLVIRCVVYLLFSAIILLMCGLTGVFHSIVNEPERLRSLFGLLCMLIISFVSSKYPSMINWRTVFWGLWLQLFLGILILRTQPGFDAFNWLGHEVETFLNYTNVGAEFVFGPTPLAAHQFLLVVLPVIIFTSAVFALLYYWKVMQVLIEALARIMHFTMGTSGAESFATASNIFVGMTVAPLAIKPYLNEMTKSEMHAVIVGGFATIAGSVLAIFISFNISAPHLLAASFMSAPAALVTAKMFLPETKTPQTAKSASVQASKAPESNALEAMYVGATDGLKICGYILANILAIISVLAFVNAALEWLGSLVNIEALSFQLICRYLLYPLAWLLGVEAKDCMVMAELIGIKAFLNEIVAYQAMGEYVANGQLTRRSEVIATYALCGFANLGSIGVMMGGLIPLVPHRKSEISKLCVRAFLAAMIALFMTACVAGLLYDETQLFDPVNKVPMNNE